ncbi:MAG: sulfite exporter TauE/SafE family protein [Candidatus Levybacteria bacterium]|nr:sulfite exporter TauE/SafE family protein [Candidatus Levybacteria bacterium]
MIHPLSTLILGFFLGLTHALEADHLIAVSTMLTTSKNPLKAMLVGMFWGIGHTTTLFLVGLIVLVLHVSIPESVNTGLEGLVGIMLIFLGISTLRRKTQSLHEHEHAHTDGDKHTHLHANHTHRHHRSFLIGTIHGLAGSGVLMVLVLSTINSVLQGIIYIILFGAGSIAGMSVMSLLFGLPVRYSHRFERINQVLHVLLGFVSVGFGGFVLYETLTALQIL